MTRKTIKYLNQKKQSAEKIVCISAYTYPTANLIDEFCDVILVGDSLGMTIYGHKNTLKVTTQMMIDHGKAVVEATKNSFIIVDLPYGSYEKSKDQALETCQRIIKETSCDAVKIETTPELIETIEFLTKNNISVVSHVGLTPQHIEKFGGFKIQGKNNRSKEEIYKMALDSENHGAVMVVIEGVIKDLADKITKNINIPTIGIGASVNCDGQILVIDDILGIKQEYSPKFIKTYSSVDIEIKKAAAQFAQEVRNSKFPTDKHCFF
jgi:3-methyl-2-oxobutanoate hydroxymethyltransferase